MGRARKRPKLEEGEVSSSDDDCIIIDAPVNFKKGRESTPKAAQGPSHHLSTSKPNTASYPFCGECCRYFLTDTEKEKHNSKWHYRNLCHACDEGFPTQAELQQHKAAHAKNPLCCIGCEKRFNCYSGMMKHLEHGSCESACTGRLIRSAVATHRAHFHRLSTRNIDLQCPACDMKCPRMSTLLSHFEKRACTLRNWIEETGWSDFLIALKEFIEENKASALYCPVCRKSFETEVKLSKHLRTKHEHTYCCACKTHFASPAKKQKHVMSGLPVKSGTFLCDHCDPKVRFGSEKELCDHLWLDHMACGPCGQVFKTAALKKKHDAEAHNRCALCYRFFKSSAELKQHRETHNVEPRVVESPVVEPSVYDPSARDFSVPKYAYLAAHPEAQFGYIATSALVLDTSITSESRILLLQRAASDDDPNMWEPPGGACDDEDESILSAAARELREEAGLEAKWIGGPVGEPHFFTLDDGKRVCQFNFLVKVDLNSQDVKLSPEEHQRFVWASESEVRERKAGDIDLEFTRDEVQQTVLAAFQYAKDIK
ncbi:NUDIX domain-containing protein [Fusarium pseudocircinatum]|uniref:NUDIX domain-containing protein n=1 Tax=Fusarium pseudocircinatum TaxID=56676 RepID=A0A8H5PXK4_9HYPO|nr:NUDIX domain-containing protein [Fusarium pseudocircinatum]